MADEEKVVNPDEVVAEPETNEGDVEVNEDGEPKEVLPAA